MIKEMAQSSELGNSPRASRRTLSCQYYNEDLGFRAENTTSVLCKYVCNMQENYPLRPINQYFFKSTIVSFWQRPKRPKH